MALKIIEPDIVTATGAACLDGSAPGYYYRLGATTSKRWIIYLEGGGWCANGGGSVDNFESCATRASTDTGSSKGYPPTTPDYGGVLSAAPSVNPDFHQDNHVFVKYCDGSSWTSYRQHPVNVDGRELHFRGRSNLVATFKQLRAALHLQGAQEVILTGGSAGGLAVMLNMDFVATLLPRTVRFTGYPDAGFFLDAPNAAGEHVWYKNWIEADKLWHSTLSNHTNTQCLAAYPATQSWKCLMAPYVLPHIETPLYIINSQVDLWSTEFILGLHCAGWPSPGGGGAAWPPNCSSSETAAINLWRTGFQAAIAPLFEKARSGAYIDTCLVHSQNVDYCYSQPGNVHGNCVGWNSFLVLGRTPQQAFSEYYFNRSSTVFLVDNATCGNNPTCPPARIVHETAAVPDFNAVSTAQNY